MDTALFACSSGKKKGLRCFKCGKPGYQQDCLNHDRKGKGKDSGGGQGKGRNEARGGRKAEKEDLKALAAKESDSGLEYAFVLLKDLDEIALAACVAADAWVSDLATMVCIVHQHANFSTYEPTPGCTLKGASIMPILGIGDINFKFKHQGHKTVIQLCGIVHAPTIPHNLITLGCVEAGRHSIMMGSGMIQFLNLKGWVYVTGEYVGNLYMMWAAIVLGKPTDITCAVVVACPKQKRTYNE